MRIRTRLRTSTWLQFCFGFLAAVLLVGMAVVVSVGSDVLRVLPYLLLPAGCLLMHLFMHRGHGSGNSERHGPH